MRIGALAFRQNADYTKGKDWKRICGEERVRMEKMCREFGATTSGELTAVWTLKNECLTAEVITYGAALRRLVYGGVDVVLGYDTLPEYERNDGCFGATVGRVCNRIGGASFTLNSKAYPLAKNDGENHLHGGMRGFDKRVWTAEPLEDGVRLRRVSPDGEEGYPGTLAVSVAYRLAGASLRIEYEAESDADTLCSLTNHSYFNLAGHDRTGKAMEQLLVQSGHTLGPGAGLLPHAGFMPRQRLACQHGTQHRAEQELAIRTVAEHPGTDATFHEAHETLLGRFQHLCRDRLERIVVGRQHHTDGLQTEFAVETALDALQHHA